MPYAKSAFSKFDAGDNELSTFAKALALPIRVAIIRMIVEHGNSISKDMIYTLPHNPDIISRHISELRTLKILRQTGIKGNIIYNIDEDLFSRMSAMFSMLFKTIDDLRPPGENLRAAEKKEVENPLAFENFGAFIQFHRMDLNMSQEVFSKKLGIDRADVSRIERGRKTLDADKLKLLSEILYIDLPALKKEYYSHQINELANESGLKVIITEDKPVKADY